MKKWRLPQAATGQADRLQEVLGLPRPVCDVLVQRGLTDPEEARRFLWGREPLPNPYLLEDMDKAVERISQAVEDGEYIAVYGDYDCDGITATALLYTYFQDIGAHVMYYIPDRDEEGYGLNCGAVDALHRLGVDLIVTVDNGISALEEIEYAASLGMDVVVTDHHQPRETLPKAAAVVDPHRKDDLYPNKALCGVGVAFKVICAMEGDLEGSEILEHFATLVALGTVADVVELTGENRTIVKTGLEYVSDPQEPGLAALMELAGLTGRKIDSTSLSFGLAPRINAAGRMGKAQMAVELLLTDDPEEAANLAAQLDAMNRERKELVNQILLDIDRMTVEKPELLEQRLLILAGKGWHHGVIGIAAAKLVERYSKPCLLIAVEGEEARGSARSVEGYSIIEAISKCSMWLTRFGGHDQAAGFSLMTADIDSFRQEMLADAKERFDLMPVDQLGVDAVIPAEQVTVQAVEQLALMEPFGCGNESPVFLLEDCRIQAITPLSDDKHIRLRCESGGQVFQALYFGMSSRDFPWGVGDRVEMAVSLDLNHFNGNVSVSVKIKDVRPKGLPQDKLTVGWQYYEKLRRQEPVSQKIRDYVIPTRDDVALLYRYLRQVKVFPYGYDCLWCRIGGKLNYCKMRLCLDIMKELSLLDTSRGKEDMLFLPEHTPKADLEQSRILQQLKGGDVCVYIR